MSQDKLKDLDSLLAEILRKSPLIAANTEPELSNTESQLSTLSDQPDSGEAAALSSPVDSPTHTDIAVGRAEQAKAWLAGLDLDTAIRLRWVIRDIRGRRTKMSPVAEKDLAALTDKGLVEMREGIPRLTGLGVLVLD